MNERLHAELRGAEMAAAIAANDPARVQALMLVYGMRLGQLEDDNEQRLEKDRVRQRKRRRGHEQLELMAPVTLLRATSSPTSHAAAVPAPAVYVQANHPRTSMDVRDASADGGPLPPPHPHQHLLTTTARAREETATTPTTATGTAVGTAIATTATTTAGSAGDAEPLRLADLLVAAVNRGLQARFGGTTSVVLVDPLALELAAFVAGSGAESGRVLQHLERKAMRCRMHPRRMAYFEPIVREFCARELGRGRAVAAAAMLPTLPTLASGPGQAPRPVLSAERAAAIISERADREASMMAALAARAARKGVA